MRSDQEPQRQYGVFWKCPAYEFSELLDRAGGPLPRAEIPDYATYLMSLQAGIEQAIGEGIEYAFVVLIDTAEMRRRVTLRGIDWGIEAWNAIALDIYREERLRTDANMAAGKPAEFSFRVQPVWSKATGWVQPLSGSAM